MGVQNKQKRSGPIRHSLDDSYQKTTQVSQENVQAKNKEEIMDPGVGKSNQVSKTRGQMQRKTYSFKIFKENA